MTFSLNAKKDIPDQADYNVSVLFGVKDFGPIGDGLVELVDLGKVEGEGSITGKLKTGIVLEGKTQGASFGKTKAITDPKKFSEEIKPVKDANLKVNALDGLLTFEWDPKAQKPGESISFKKVGVEVAKKGKVKPIPEPAFLQVPILLTGGAILLHCRRRNTLECRQQQF